MTGLLAAAEALRRRDEVATDAEFDEQRHVDDRDIFSE